MASKVKRALLEQDESLHAGLEFYTVYKNCSRSPELHYKMERLARWDLEKQELQLRGKAKALEQRIKELIDQKPARDATDSMSE